MQNGKIPNLVMNDFATFVRDNDDLISDINVEFPPNVERMIAQMKVILQDFPRQREAAATLSGSVLSVFALAAKTFSSINREAICQLYGGLHLLPDS